MRQHDFNVVGIYDLHTPDAEKGTVFIPLADAQTLYNLRDQVTEVPIFLKQIGSEAAVMKALQAQLPNYEIDSWQTLKGDLTDTIKTKMAYNQFHRHRRDRHRQHRHFEFDADGRVRAHP